MKNPQVITSKDPAAKAGEAISNLFARLYGRPILFLIAGGSAFRVLPHIEEDFLGTTMTVAMTDDRLSYELDENNFTSLQAEHFYNALVKHDVYCIPTEPHSGETLDEFADRFDNALKAWKKDFPKGVVVGLFGVGEDGHTAGIIPGVLKDKELSSRFDGPRFASPLDATGKNKFPHRISTTFSFMRDLVDVGVFFMTGEAKEDALDDILAEKGSLSKTPARIAREMREAYIFTDIAAK